MMEPYDIAAYSYLGTDMSKFNFTNQGNFTYSWLNDTYTDRTDTITDAFTDHASTTTNVATGANWQPGDVFLIDSEHVWIQSISGNVITVVRGFNGTTAASHEDNSVITRIRRARIEGDDADDSPSTEVTSTTNSTQIFQRTVNVSRSKSKVLEYGVSNVEDYMIDKFMKTHRPVLRSSV